MMQSPWILALIITLFFEGLIIGAAPEVWQRMMLRLSSLPPKNLRRIGLSMCITAVVLMILVYWSRP